MQRRPLGARTDRKAPSRNIASLSLLLLVFACSKETAGPAQAQASAPGGSSSAVPVAARLAKGALVAVDAKGKVLLSVKGPKMSDASLTYDARNEVLLVLHERTLHRVDEDTGKYVKVAQIPAPGGETDGGYIHNPEHFRTTRDGSQVCILYSTGDPNEPGPEDGGEGYMSWEYTVSIPAGKVSKGKCKTPIRQAMDDTKVKTKAPLSLVATPAECGLRAGKTFFPMATAAELKAGACDARVQPLSPTGRYQLAYVHRGSSDGGEINYVVYIFDHQKKTLVPLRSIYKDDWVMKPASPQSAIEVSSDSALGLLGTPWRWANTRDILHINGAFIDLGANPPTVAQGQDGAVFVD